MRAFSLRRFAILSVALAAACSSKDSTSPNNQAITVSVSPGSLTLAQGANGSVTVTAGRSGGFAGPIRLTISGAPAGVTTTASPSEIGSAATTSTIAIDVGSAVAAGNHTITIQASGAGVTEKNTTLTLTVTAVTAGSFTMALASSTLSVQQGAQGTVGATLTRTGGFTGSVSFSATGAPTGVTVSFNPASTTANTTTATIAVGGTVAAGSYTITLRATATGVTDQAANVTLTVTAPSGGSGNTVLRFCPPGNLPVFLAFQDGTGPWTAVPGTNNVYTFNIASGKGAYAYVTSSSATVFSTHVFYGTQAEIAGQSAGASCPAAATTKTVNGTVANVSAGELATIGLGAAAAVVPPGGGTAFTLQNVLDGNRDLIASRMTQTISGSGVVQNANKLIVRRNQNPAAGSTLPVLDFNASESFAPQVRTLTFNNLGTDLLTIQATYVTANVSSGIFYLEGAGSPGTATRQVPGMPAANQVAGDLHNFFISAIPPAAPQSSRALIAYYTAALDRTFTFGPAIGAVTVTTAATTPAVQLRMVYTVQPEYNKYININYGQGGGGSTRGITVFVTAGYLGGSSAFDITTPPLAGLTGWNNAWNIVAGQQTTWSLTPFGFTASGVLAPVPADGVILLTGTRQGSITP